MDAVGSKIQVHNHLLSIETIIAEGGFGFVYKVRDTDTNQIYALKKINAVDEEAQVEIENEIDILKSLQKHAHIMEFISSLKVDQSNNNNNLTTRYTYYILTEYCGRGTLIGLGLPIIELEKSCRVIYQIASGLKHIHSLGITHRDIKAENILFDNNGFVKLCDFGSATRNQYEPSSDWTRLKRSTVEDEMWRHTTPLYRPPEILETYLHYPINCAVDVWALGCLIYYMRFGQHAFPDSGKLSIVNCCYTVPKDVDSNDALVIVIKQCLKPDPNERITVKNLLDHLEIGFQELDLNGSIVPFSPTKSEPKSELSSDIVQDTLVDIDLAPPTKIINQKIIDPATKAGLIDAIPQKEESVDILLHMNDKINQKVLSPEKATTTNINTNSKKELFEDLLEPFKGSLKINSSSNYDTNLALSNGFELDAKSQVIHWRESRRGNIRALLSSLHLILSDEFNWTPIGMHQLVTDSSVKKIYHQACLAIHPDKVGGEEETKELARMIFIELNEAWSKFTQK